MLQRLFYEFMYRLSRPPWDSGVTPPEVVSLIEGGEVTRGRALDLGCGTGTNSLFLARHGFDVVGVDFAPKALALARTKARREQAQVEFVQADVTRLDFLREPFDLILDIGCFHGIPASDRVKYASTVERLARPGSIFMLYAFGASGTGTGLFGAGISQEEAQRLFTPFWDLWRLEAGTDHGVRASAWYWFRRT